MDLPTKIYLANFVLFAIWLAVLNVGNSAGVKHGDNISLISGIWFFVTAISTAAIAIYWIFK